MEPVPEGRKKTTIPVPNKIIPGVEGAARWDAYKSRPDIVYENGSRIRFYDFTDREKVAQRATEFREREAAEKEDLERLRRALAELAWREVIKALRLRCPLTRMSTPLP